MSDLGSTTGAASDGGVLGVVVMAYGTPARIEDVEGYYTHIRRGRPPEPAQLDDLVARYRAIGLAEGRSPLAEATEAQRAALETALGPGHRVVLGQKHAAPFVEDAVAQLLDEGIDEITGVVLAPHYSSGSVGQYVSRMRAAAGDRARVTSTDSWAMLDEHLDLLAAAVSHGLEGLPVRTKVLFTAHSLPERVLLGGDGTPGDPYPDQLATSAAAVARRAGLAPWAGWGLAWQSAGRTAERWKGPDVLQVIDDLAGTGRSDGVLVCPQGFTCDHLEVAYDLDIEATARAKQVGLAFARTRTVGADPTVMGALARLVAANHRAALAP